MHLALSFHRTAVETTQLVVACAWAQDIPTFYSYRLSELNEKAAAHGVDILGPVLDDLEGEGDGFAEGKRKREDVKVPWI